MNDINDVGPWPSRPAVVYVGTDGTMWQLDSVVELPPEREQRIAEALMRYVLDRFDGAAT